ncbi:LicD family protein [Aliiglaciecola sp. M165]|uniref:LicD family protein n=1 Tax=Aliiglaciecola sp. M165 TaxID=2593649 RepID=UPI00117F093F|nr:LicD family protein [Aliiglaciecola sp. M165]TRY30942.1 LicD family protein [Aliiglaciecola sp. M165]
MEYKLNKIYSDYANVHEVCREVLDIADAKNIESVLIGGSLLGIVRDGDFLPWDKDLDFAVFEADIEKTLGLENEYRSKGYECRVHHLGVRDKNDLKSGEQLIADLTQTMIDINLEHCLIGGALLNLYRDKCLLPEIDTIGWVIDPKKQLTLDNFIRALSAIGEVHINCPASDIKSITLISDSWRSNFFIYVTEGVQSGWRDLNCEYWFDNSLFPAQKVIHNGKGYFAPANTEKFLESRFGDNWNIKPAPKFKTGRVVGSMQLYKNGVMFDFIMHYVRGEKTYWFEPAANVISTLGFTPYSMKDTTAGIMRIPDHPEVFLEEHYPNWRVPVKEWNGAVDNPTIIDSNYAMSCILNKI